MRAAVLALLLTGCMVAVRTQPTPEDCDLVNNFYGEWYVSCTDGTEWVWVQGRWDAWERRYVGGHYVRRHRPIVRDHR